jgi:hypothetical protein
MSIFKWFLSISAVGMLLVGTAFAVDEPVLFKDAKFVLEGDYELYGKYFNERDINKYDGNEKRDAADHRAGQTDREEAWLQHELRLKPGIIFNDKLEAHMRLDVGPYLFQSDHNDRIYITQEDLVTGSKRDAEKLRVKDAFVQMVSPVGLFVVGRFEGGNGGLVWAAQFPQVPGWTFVVAWNKKNEEKHDWEDPDVPYTSPLVRNEDYKDRDDMDEVKVLTIYENKDKTLKSEQWADFRLGYSHSNAKNMQICLPQWKVTYNKGNLHWWHTLGTGLGELAELTKMPAGDDIRTLVATGVMLNGLNPVLYDFPVVKVKDMGPIEGKSWSFTFVGSYDMGKLSPEVGMGYTTGADTYNVINAFLWDENEPQGYRTPRKFKTLLIGEIEDKYYPLLATLATAQAFNQNDVSFNNMTFLKAGATYHISDKIEFFGQLFPAWRTNTKYFKKDYWDMFPLMYALNNQRVNDTNGHTEVPFVFKRKDTNYGKSIDNFLGLEIDGRLTYKLFDGLDISLLGAYFKTGDFYKDVLTPKQYKLQWVDANTTGTLGSPEDLYGPYVGADAFDLSDAWTVQFKVDFKWKI